MVTNRLSQTRGDIFTHNEERAGQVTELTGELSTRIRALQETYPNDYRLKNQLAQAEDSILNLGDALNPNYKDKEEFYAAHNLTDASTDEEFKQAYESPIYTAYLEGIKKFEELLIFLSHDARTNKQSAIAICKIVERATDNKGIGGDDHLSQLVNDHIPNIKPAPFGEFYQSLNRTDSQSTMEERIAKYSEQVTHNYRLLLRDLDVELRVGIFENGKYAWERGVTAENIKPQIPAYTRAEQVPEKDVIANGERYRQLRQEGIFGRSASVRGPNKDEFVDRYKGRANLERSDGKTIAKKIDILNLIVHETRLRSEDAGIDLGVAYLPNVGLHEEAHYRGWTMTIDTMVKAVDFRENLEQNSLTQIDKNGKIVGYLVPVTAKEVVTNSSGQQEVAEATKWVLISKDVYSSWTKELDRCIRSYEESGFDIATERERLRSHREQVAILDENVAAQEDWINVLRAANGLRTLEKDILEQIPENERGTYIDILKGLLTSYEQFSQHFREHTYYSTYAKNMAEKIGNSIPGFTKNQVHRLAEQRAAEIHEELKELYLKYASEILYLLKNTQLSQKDLEQLLLNIDTELKRRVKTLEFKRLFGLSNYEATSKANALIPLRQERVTSIADDTVPALTQADFAQAAQILESVFNDTFLSVDANSINESDTSFATVNRKLKALGIRELTLAEYRLIFEKIKSEKKEAQLQARLRAETLKRAQAEKRAEEAEAQANEQRGQSEQGHKTKSRVYTAAAQEAVFEFSAANDIIDYINKGKYVDSIELTDLQYRLSETLTYSDLEAIANDFLVRHKKNIDNIYKKYGSNITAQDVMEAFIKRYGLQLADFDDDDLALTAGGSIQTIVDESTAQAVSEAVLAPEERNAPIVSPEIQAEVERFVNAIQRSDVFGKLPNGTKIGNIVTNRGMAYNHHGADELENTTSYKTFHIFYSRTVTNPLSNHGEQRRSQVVTVDKAIDNTNTRVVRIWFLQDKNQIDGRGHPTEAYVAVELPNNMISEFVTTIKNNPDALEQFYRQAFPGLDSENNAPGMRRIQSDGFYILQEPELNTVDNIDTRNNRQIDAFYATLPKYTYQNGPYGVGELS